MSRLLADESIHVDLSTALRAAGHDVSGVVDRGLAGSSDRRLLEIANVESRILFTADKDFGGILEFGALAGTGRVLLLRYRTYDPEKIAADVIALLAQLGDAFDREPGLLIVLSEGRYREHKPPRASD